MNEQKNLYLAIAISIAIIVFFQLLFPTTITEPIKEIPLEPGYATALKILEWMRLLKILHQPFVEK